MPPPEHCPVVAVHGPTGVPLPFGKRVWHDAYLAVGRLLTTTGGQTKAGLEGTKEVCR